MEDGVTLGICLALSPKTPDGCRLALKAFQKIRHKRAADVQMTGRTQVRANDMPYLSLFVLSPAS